MEVFCPKCGQHLKTPDEAAGKKVRCAQCARVFVVTLPEAEAFEYSTEILGQQQRNWGLAKYLLIAAPVLLGCIWIAVVLSNQNANEPDPLRTFKERLKTATASAQRLRAKKYEATNPHAIAYRKSRHMEPETWSEKDEHELAQWEAEQELSK